MKVKKGYFVHTVCLGVLFLLGDAVITQPFKGANEFTVLGFALAALIASLIAFISFPLTDNLFYNENKSNGNKLKKYAKSILYILICIWVISEASKSFSVFSDFVIAMILPGASKLLVAVVLGLSALAVCVEGHKVVLKFSLFASVLTAAAVILFFVFSFGELRMENISLLRFPELDGIWKQTLGFLYKVFLPVIIYIIYVRLNIGEKRNKETALGILFGAIILGVCLINTLLLFGPKLSGELKFPYAAAIGTVTIGELFTRMDGFSYLIYFAAILVKLTVCIDIIKKYMALSGEKREKFVALISLVLIISIGSII